MASGAQNLDRLLLASLLGQTQPELRDDLGELGERNPAGGILGVRLQQGIQAAPASNVHMVNNLLVENTVLRGELQKMHNVVQNSKIETAELCSKFGELANDWSETVKQINAIHEEQRKEYERRIEALEKTNQQLVKENEEMKKVIEDFKKLESEFKKQKRMLKLGQIAYKLEVLVSEYVFPGDDKASKRARYGTNLKSLKEKINNLKDQRLRKEAASRLEGLDEEMFEGWFLGIVKELKKLRLDTAHPELGTYDEMKSVIGEEFRDDDKRDDMLTALEHLQDMYRKMERNFGE